MNDYQPDSDAALIRKAAVISRMDPPLQDPAHVRGGGVCSERSGAEGGVAAAEHRIQRGISPEETEWPEGQTIQEVPFCMFDRARSLHELSDGRENDSDKSSGS